MAGFLQWARGVFFFGFMMLSAIVGVCFLMCPIEFFILPVAPRLGHWLTHQIFQFWLSMDVALTKLIVGYKVNVTAASKERGRMMPNESAIIIVNHRTEIDWILMFHLGYHVPASSVTLRVVLKDVLCHVPGIGWAMRMLGYAFVARRWEMDKGAIERCIERYTSKQLPIWLLIFPEGTALYWRSLERNTKYMTEKNLKPFNYVLMPREKGFIHCLRKMGPQTAVYDMALGFPSIRDEEVRPTLKNIVNGDLPSMDIHMHRWSADEVPHGGTDEEVAEWLHARFREKETRLEKYYTTPKKDRPPGGFPGVNIPSKNYPHAVYWMLIAVWVLITYLEIKLVMWSQVAFWWQMVCVTIFLTWNYVATRKKGASKKF